MVTTINRYVSAEPTEQGFKVINTIVEHYSWVDYEEVLDNCKFGKHNKDVELDRYEKMLKELSSLKEHVTKLRENRKKEIKG